MKFVMDSLKAKTTVVDGSTTPPYTLRESSDYTIDYLSIGKTEANVIIAGNGEYTGSVDRTVRLVSTAPAGPSMPAKGRGQGLGDTIYTAVKRALGEPASEEAFGSSYGLGDTIYTAIKKAMAGKGGGGEGGGASLTGNLTQLLKVNSEPSGYPYNGAPIAVRATAGINGHTVALGSFDTMIAGADITLKSAPGGAWLVVPTSATLDPSTGPSFEFTKTALTITGNTVHIPDDIPEPLTVEYEVEGETFTDTALPYIGIIEGENPK